MQRQLNYSNYSQCQVNYTVQVITNSTIDSQICVDYMLHAKQSPIKAAVHVSYLPLVSKWTA